MPDLFNFSRTRDKVVLIFIITLHIVGADSRKFLEKDKEMPDKIVVSNLKEKNVMNW